jgi:hypothetical protein
MIFQISSFEAVAGQEKHLSKLQTSVSYANWPTTFAGGGLYGKSRLEELANRVSGFWETIFDAFS